MILSAQSILSRSHMVTPFCARSVSHGMTYGLGPAGYDVRIAEYVSMPARSFALASTVERFAIPDDISAFTMDKSTWARRGLSLFNTVLEPGWEGILTLELTNQSDKTLVIEAGMPIAQIVFHCLDEPTAWPYRGKYQNQSAGPVEAILED